MQVKHKIILALALMLACMGLNLNLAYAEEVELNPTDFFTYTSHFQDNTHDVEIVTDSCVNTPVLNANGHYYERWVQGDFLTGGAAKVAYKTPAMTDSDHSGLTYFDGNKYTNLYYYHWDGYDYTVPSFQLTFHDSSITLDVTNLLPGWYRYEAEIYVGVTVFGNANGPTFDPIFTYDTTEIPLGVNGKIYYAGTEDLTTGGYGKLYGTQLVHFHFDDTWEVDPQVEEYTWNITPAFQYLISSLQYSGGLTTRMFGVATNNRFQSKLFGSVEPIVSPTPIPTPYPGQDTQESINQGVQQIVQGLDVQATPIPTPEAFTVSPTDLEILETMTLPDLSDTAETVNSIWDIFAPAGWFIAALVSAILVTSIFLYVLRGGWL